MTRGKRSIQIEGVRHAAPIPMGARIDNVVYSSAIMGMDPGTGNLPDDGIEQVRLMFANLASFLQAADVTTNDIVRMTVHLADPSLRDEVDRYWLELFPDERDRPARNTMIRPLNQTIMRAQLEVIAIDGS